MGQKPAAARPTSLPFGRQEIIRLAEEVIRAESDALARLAGSLDEQFIAAVELAYHATGSIVVSGIGKAGWIGQKIAATMASTGTRAHFLHPAEAVHGDLGRIARDDVVLIISQSGETAEVVRLLPSIRSIDVPIIAITGRPRSSVGRAAGATIDLGPLTEACPLGLAPSTSTTAMLAAGDALSLVLSKLRGFRAEDFAQFHPGGSLGRKLAKVESEMRPLRECRIENDKKTVREVVVACSRPGRRTGAIMLVDDSGRLAGMFTDSDLARLFETHNESALDRPIRDAMTAKPARVTAGERLLDAIDEMANKKISELPVVDRLGRPLGLIDITDLVGQGADLAQSKQTVVENESTIAKMRIFDVRANAG